MKVPFEGLLLEYPHEEENTKCPECWTDYPKPCKCGALVHAQLGEDTYVDYLYRWCDNCGASLEEVEE